MKIEQANIAHIRTAFQNMQSKEDLLQLLNEVKPIIYGEKTVLFEMKQLTWYSNPKLAKKRYTSFPIKKKSGAERTIHAPVKGLKVIQKTLSFILQCVYEPHKAATGFVREKSIVDNAKEHIGSKYVYNIDLKDFFPSVDQARVWKCLQLQPFNLNNQNTEIEEKVISKTFSFDEIKKELNFTHARILDTYKGVFLHLIKNVENRETYISVKIDNTISLIGETLDEKVNDIKTNYFVYTYVTDKGTYFKLLHNKDIKNKDRKITKSRQQIASIIASLCCNEMEVERMNISGEWILEKRNVLPQGAPTSPILTNVVCKRLDYLLSAVANRFGLKYSRYADDITFSSMHNVYQSESDFIKELHRIIAEQGFHIKESKTRLQKEGYRKEVTGLLVNDKVNVQKRYIKQLRMWLYYWETYGYERAQSFFLQQYIADKRNSVKGKPDMINVIDGKLNYLKMVKGDSNNLYLKLRERFDKLTIIIFNSKTISEAEIKNEFDNDQVRISLEVYQSPKMNKKLNNSINIPKDTLLPNTFVVSNSVEKISEIEDDKPKKLFPHNPIYTTSFLKKFKIGDGSGFKELVHDVILTDEIINEILNKVKSHPNFINHYKNEKIAGVSFLNRGIVMSVRELIDYFEKEGIPYYNNTERHPFNNDREYTNFAKQFKKKYRYGSGSEYSKLQSDIISIFNDQKVSMNSLSFLPDERKFNIRSSFFTWQPSIFNGIRYIVQGIRDHSNINGAYPFDPLKKSILVEVEKIQAESQFIIELSILDCNSVAKIDSTTLLHFLQGSSPYEFDFRNLCDWIVECDFLEESPKRINLLTVPEYSQSLQEIEELPIPVGGFKHILRFYDVR